MKPDLAILGHSKAVEHLRLSLERTTTLSLGEDAILFIAGAPVAVRSGGFVYFVDAAYAASQTKAINAFTSEHPLVRIPADQFDFIVGSTLTKAGLPLTRRDNRTEQPDSNRDQG